MSTEREIVGEMDCMNCGEKVIVKKNIRGHYYYNCSWGEGGCGCQHQNRTNDADMHLLKKLKKEHKKAENDDVEPKTNDKSYLDYMA